MTIAMHHFSFRIFFTLPSKPVGAQLCSFESALTGEGKHRGIETGKGSRIIFSFFEKARY